MIASTSSATKPRAHHRAAGAGTNITKPRLELGDPADTIIRCAKEEGCDLIVMAAKRLGRVRSALLRKTGVTWGSVAAQVVKLADIPVVVVK